jgi:uncharacterized membrane-anchored protein YitT (DUF2179 family)
MKRNIKKYLLDAFWIAVGCFILALGINLFLAPNKISSGGVSSIGTVLLHLFGIRISLTNIVANAILFFFGFRYLGKYAVVKTIEGIALFSLSLEVVSLLPIYTEDLIMATIIGGALVGLGVGLVVRKDGSTGGSDFSALILKRFFPHISLAHLILILDCAVVAFAGIIFKSISITFYSLIAMYVSSKITDTIVTLGDSAKEVRIFSSQVDRIAKEIMERFERGVTAIYGKGMYSGKDSINLLCVVSPKELPALVHTIKEIDPASFIIINDAKEVLGEGFKEQSPYQIVKNKK